jgi:hypothetical protein
MREEVEVALTLLLQQLVVMVELAEVDPVEMLHNRMMMALQALLILAEAEVVVDMILLVITELLVAVAQV